LRHDDTGDTRVIDQTKLKAPGWQRIVADLSSPAPDDKAFAARLVSVLAQVAGARQAVLFIVAMPTDASAPPPEAKPAYVWPPQDTPVVEHASDAAGAASSAAAAGQVMLFALESNDQLYDGTTGRGYVIAVPVTLGMRSSPVRWVVTLLTESRSKQAIQTTLALVEVLAGYTHGHATRQQLRSMQAATASLDLAARLIASINDAPSFRGAMLQLSNDLARHLDADRVAIGWLRGGAGAGRVSGGTEQVRVLAISDTEHFDRRMEMVRKLEAAQEECLDQEQAVLYPAPPEKGEDADVLLSQAITHAHRELAAGDANLRVCSLPMRTDERVLGVMTIEASRPEGEGGTGSAGGLDLSSIETLQATLDLITPVLRIRRSDDRALPLRAWDSTVKAAGVVVGPKHTVWKLVALAVMILAFVVVFVKVPYNIESDATLEPSAKQIISAPFEGIIKGVAEGIEAGAEVDAGQPLLRLDDAELRLQAAEERGALLRAMTEADAYLKENKLPEQQQALARATSSRAKLDRFELYINQADVRAPINGTIITGDLKDRIGGKADKGEPLFEIAPLDTLVVRIKVDDRDIRFIREGMPGHLARKANPGERIPIVVKRIVPLAKAEEGKNTFEVWAELDTQQLDEQQRRSLALRPGMEGLAKLDTGKRSLLWIGTRRIKDTLRLWLWW
jgi:multidrug resistance efflux pump